ncbi:MAG: SDR family NAD(P)-dependent oxidoreductase [Pseudomonadota bacterium]
MPDTGQKALESRVILITGAAGGLGNVAAKACAAEGATIILLDKTIPGLERVYDDIVSSGAPQPAIYPFDLNGAAEQDYRDLSRIIDEKYGVLHGLLHSAAEFGVLTPISCLDPATWSTVVNVNLNAPFLLTQVLLPLMRRAEDASIVFTSDSSARRGRAYWSIYGVSKIAVEGFARTLADELESAGVIRVNTLVPGPIASPLRKRAYPAEDFSKLAPPETLRCLYRYLLGPASRGITGRIFEGEFYTGSIG